MRMRSTAPLGGVVVTGREGSGASDAPIAPGEPWDRYARAVVEIEVDGAVLELTPRPLGAPGTGTGSDAGDAAGAPVGGLLPSPVTILTACDPFPRVLDAAENAARTAALVAELDAAGITHLPALGRSPDHRESEVSRALVGVDRATALRIAAAHEQLAVFEIDAAGISCVAVADATVRTRCAHDAVLRR
jgi:hypothetical protein